MPIRIKKQIKKVNKGRQPPKRVVGTVKSAARIKKTAKAEIRIFISYSHKDAGAEEQLQTHLATLKRDGVTIWSDNDIEAGDALNSEISLALRRAHMFVALLSPDYIASNYCWNIEYKRAMGRRARGTMRVVAAVIRPCTWKSTRAAGFKLLPKDGRAVYQRSPFNQFLHLEL